MKRHRTIHVLFGLLLFAGTLYPVAPAFADQILSIRWIDQFGSSSIDTANSVATDGSGNVYVAGDALTALPGETASGSFDAFLRKYDAGGSVLWTDQFGTTESDAAHSVATDAFGNVYVVGRAGGTLPGETSPGGSDAFLRKYDSAGSVLWTEQFGSSAHDSAFSVATDASGSVYVAGSAGPLPSFATSGAFLRKYDPAGSVLWTDQFGPASFLDNGFAVTTDASGVYIAGSTWGTFPGETSSGNADAYLRKYDAAGSMLWTDQFGTTAIDAAVSLATDASGDVYVAGSIGNSGVLPGETNHGGNSDAFLRKYDAAGSALWTDQFGTSASDGASEVATEASGNVYVVGSTGGSLPGETSSGALDPYVRKYDAAGSVLGTDQFGTTDEDQASSVDTDGSGNVYVFGSTFLAFPGEINSGSRDVFVFSYSNPLFDGDVDEDETVTTDPGPGDMQPSGSDPIQTDVTAPNDNTTVTVTEMLSNQPDQQGYDFPFRQVMIEVNPDGTVSDPIAIGFSLDASLLPPGTTASQVQMFADHSSPFDDPQFVPTCTNPALKQAAPDPCVALRLDGPSVSPNLGPGDVYLKIYTSTASAWWFGAPNASLPCTITGTNGNDVIKGSGSDDVICALGGKDQVFGRGGHDVIYGGPGNDLLYGETGNDQVWGDAGDDEVIGNGHEDELHGGTGNDDIWGSGADDAMYGEAGNDSLHGHEGDETMFGGPGVDESYGGEGDDFISGGAGKDLLVGGPGVETIDGGDGDDSIFGNVDADVLSGGLGEDQISAGEGDDVIDTGNDDGDNLVHAGDGDDTITAYDGSDEIVTGSGDDTVDAGDGDNVVFTQGGDDDLTLGSDDDLADAGEGDDTVADSGGDNEILLGGGDDSVETLGGDDVLAGEKGDDSIDGGDGDNSVDGNEGEDTIWLGVDTSVAACVATPSDPADCSSTASAGDNSVSGGGGDDTIVTGNGDDHLLADGGKDHLDAMNGENALDGGEGNDVVLGGIETCATLTPVACTPYASAEDQSVLGGGGHDLLVTGNGDDHVLGGDGKDEIHTNGGEDGVDGGEGDDVIFSGDEASPEGDEVLGGGGNDEIDSGAGDDYVVAGFGNDDVQGGDGDDAIYGHPGNDDIDGGGNADYDICFGNEGTNTIVNCEDGEF